MEKIKKGQKTDNQIKENLQKKTYISTKKRDQGKTHIQEIKKPECPKNRQEFTQKMVKGIEKGQTCKKTTNL